MGQLMPVVCWIIPRSGSASCNEPRRPVLAADLIYEFITSLIGPKSFLVPPRAFIVEGKGNPAAAGSRKLQGQGRPSEGATGARTLTLAVQFCPSGVVLAWNQILSTEIKPPWLHIIAGQI